MSGNSMFSLIIFFVAFAVIFIISRAAGMGIHYDEMQLKTRGDAYKLGFFTIVVLIAAAGVCFAVGDTGISDYISQDMILFTILYAGVIVFSVYSIAQNAFFSVRDKGNVYISACIIVIATNIPALIAEIVNGEFRKNGILSYNNGGANILNLILFIAMLAAIMIKRINDKKEPAE